MLVSGSGSNLQAIIDAISNKTLDAKIEIVISNKKDPYALQRAQKAGIKTAFINPLEFTDNTDFDKKLIEIIAPLKIDLIVLAGYTRILTDYFAGSFQNKIINIHPALLPNFGGRGMYGKKVHEAVLKSGAKESGCTVHFVTNEVDLGPIILQKKVPVMPGDTVETLSKRILEKEHELLVEAIEKVFSKVKT